MVFMLRILNTITRPLKLSVYSALLTLSAIYAHEPPNSVSSIPATPSQSQPTLPPIFIPGATPLKTINKIIITGNHSVSHDTIRAQIPFNEGDILKAYKIPALIKSLYALKSTDDTKIGGYFNAVDVKAEDVGPDEINLHIIVEEKKQIESITFVGNNHLKQSDIDNKLHLSQIKALDTQELSIIADNIAKLYAEKDYHDAIVTPTYKPVDEFHIAITFNVEEGSPTYVKRILFEGNTTFTSKKLRSFLITKEDWILGFLQKAGSYHPEALQYDRRMIEDFYQSNGFLTARVTETRVVVDPACNGFVITFVIDEGELYTVDKVAAEGNYLMSEEEILMRIPIRSGQLYSKEQVRFALEGLRVLWGEYGFIDADVNPSIQADKDTKTVSIKFLTDLGSKKTVNRISIIGNNKTRDSVIRRQISFNEGELLTVRKMDDAKAQVERLGYFEDRNGVNWKINRIDDEQVDLDLVVQERKTGSVTGSLSFGGDDTESDITSENDSVISPVHSLKVALAISNINFMGTGISYILNGNISRQDNAVNFSIFNPWLFDRPLSAGINFGHQKRVYDENRGVTPRPVEHFTGASGKIGFVSPRLGYSQIILQGGFERIRFNQITADIPRNATPQQAALIQVRVHRQFESGDVGWISASIEQDRRNRPIFPSSGYNIVINTKLAPPIGKLGNFAFIKFEADGTWYTPLINEYDLVFSFHTHIGFVHPLPGRNVPFRELFHIGGPANVRGFLFGQISPSINGDSLGATKAFWVNAELQFPIMKDNTVRGVFFYDGGTGWDALDTNPLLNPFIRNNKFSYRHAIGFGVRLTSPTPLQIDWGFKLDRKRRLGETASEVHFNMSHDF
jgi:outer membrane protein insertion porin family